MRWTTEQLFQGSKSYPGMGYYEILSSTLHYPKPFRDEVFRNGDVHSATTVLSQHRQLIAGSGAGRARVN